VVTNLSVCPSCLCLCSFCFWGKYYNSLIWNNICRNCLLGQKENSQIFNEDFYLPLYLPLCLRHTSHMSLLRMATTSLSEQRWSFQGKRKEFLSKFYYYFMQRKSVKMKHEIRPRLEKRAGTHCNPFRLDCRLNMELYSFAETPQPPPPAFGFIYEGRALLVSQDRRHLFVTPCSQPVINLSFAPS
jgi:hypothetical protein